MVVRWGASHSVRIALTASERAHGTTGRSARGVRVGAHVGVKSVRIWYASAGGSCTHTNGVAMRREGPRKRIGDQRRSTWIEVDVPDAALFLLSPDNPVGLGQLANQATGPTQPVVPPSGVPGQRGGQGSPHILSVLHVQVVRHQAHRDSTRRGSSGSDPQLGGLTPGVEQHRAMYGMGDMVKHDQPHCT